ncbi:hypothetical protein G2W53_038793 [Senna tora]|uniref:Uncharacterized protein n=1 Tax=Senna tora TaxID=362788 RepID=A0A834W296_9FABA|nr:hypothetical protein G2W53_038793 [Senna tora]
MAYASIMLHVLLPCQSQKTRNSSVGCSSRTSYYYGSGEGVPFQWEMKPGIAIHDDDINPPIPLLMESELPPLTPPPALLSLTLLPKPSMHHHHHHLHHPRASSLRRRLWKRITRKLKGKEGVLGKKCQERSRDIDDDAKDFDVFERFLESNDSDFDSFASPCEISFSSSSSSSSSLCRPSMHSTRSESPSTSRETYGRHLSCIPIHFPKNPFSILKRD